MAQIDLSRLNIPVADVPRGQQIFSGEGQKSYEALANVTQNLGNMAIDLYNKQRDVNTDRSSQAAYSQMDTEVAAEKARALINVNPDTNFVEGTQNTFEQHIAKFREDKFNQYSDALEDDLARGKFNDFTRPKIAQDNISDLFTGIALTKKNTVNNYDKDISLESDKINSASAATSFRTYSDALERLKVKDTIMTKSIGLGPTTEASEKGRAILLKTKLATDTRNAESLNAQESQMAADSFGKSTGAYFGLGSFGEYKKYMLLKLEKLGIDENTPEAIKAPYADILKSLEGTGENFRYNKTQPADPNYNLLTPEEKTQRLDKFLDVKFKTEKKGYDHSDNQLNQWKANVNAKGSPEDIKEFASIVNDPNYTKSHGVVDKIEAAVEGAFKGFLHMAKKDFISSGGTNQATWTALIDKHLEGSLPAYLNAAGVTKEMYDKAAAERPSSVAAMKDREAALSTLSSESEKWRTEMNNNPGMAAMLTDGVADKWKDISTVDSNGVLVLNPQKARAFHESYTAAMEKIGTPAAGIETTKLMPDEQAKKFVDQINLQRPDQQIKSYKSINAMGRDMAYSFYAQAVSKSGMSLRQANVFMNMKDSDTPTKDAYNVGLIERLNKYTDEPTRKALEKNLSVKSRFGNELDFKEVSDKVSELIKDNPVMDNMKKIARASGVSDGQIQIMFDDQNLKWAVLESISKDGAEVGFLSSLDATISPYVDKAVGEMFDNKIINSDKVKTVVPSNSKVDIEEVKNNANSAIENLKDGLYNGNYKIDFTDMAKMVRGRDVSKLSQDTLQTIFLKDHIDGLSFISGDSTGKNPDLYLMSKNVNGGYTRLKLLDSQGNAQVLKVSPDGLASTSFNKKMTSFSQPANMGDIPRGFKATPTSPTLESRKYVPTTLREEQALANKILGVPAWEKNKTSSIDETVFKFATAKGRDEFSANPYKSLEGGADTVGYGHKIKPGEKFTYPMTEKFARELFDKDMATAKKELSGDLKVKLSPTQTAALQVMYFGTTADARKGTIALVNAGKFKEAAANIRKIVTAGGKVQPGLVTKFNAIADLFEKGK